MCRSSKRLPVALPLAFVALALGVAAAGPLPAAVDPALLAGMKARAIGPATTSGRISAVEAAASAPNVLYVGAASGGVWKSVDGGLTWEPIFDDQPVASIGAIAADPANPDVVWVGTGEGNPRNSASVGDGVYRSLDGGKTWTHVGLEASERIPVIVLDPRDPRVAYVAAMGREWGENPERGVFKTEDGGKSWKKVLYVDERTGAADLVMDPGNPNKLFAAMWDYRRWPWSFRSGGPGSGLFVTYDGGATWKRLTEDDGLPKGDLGRIGLAIAPSDPRRVYALVEAKQSALVRSEDGGKSWKSVNAEPNVSPRPFYFAHIRVDSQDPNRIYRLHTEVDVSDDGGRTWGALIPFRDIHPDHHAMWIDPRDATYIVEGNDGGVAISHDRGVHWRFVQNLPVAQFYHVRVDFETPYNLYGGLQDNGSWKGPSAVWATGGIRNFDWHELDFGDGFDSAPDPRDPSRGYAMSQEGFLVRYDLQTGERKDIRPPPPKGVKLRFNWNSGLGMDPFDPDTLYYGSQFLHRSTDRGETWTILSPDLTTNRREWQRQDESGGLTLDASGAENYTTILAIAPSPAAKGVIWVGTDDGRLQVTRDGGQSWQSVEGNLPGAPANAWIPHVEPSRFDAGTAFVVLDDHRRSNWTPYVYRTADYGKTWKSLAAKNLRGYCLAIAQDPVDRDLLFLGTEFGLYVSLDGGGSWMPWKHGLPTVSVMELLVHPRDGDLVIATHGRGFYILDDVRPLRSLTEAALKEPIHLFEIPDAVEHRVAQPASTHFPGHDEFRGENRPYGALLTYSLNLPGLPLPDDRAERARKEAEREKRRREERRRETAVQPEESREERAASAAEPESRSEEPGGKKSEEKPQAEIQILDAAGKVICTFQQPATLGLNRAVWDLARNPFRSPPRPARGERPARSGPQVVPGTYTVRVRYADHEATGSVRVLPDPRSPATAAAPAAPTAIAGRQANDQAVLKAGALEEALATAVERVQRTRADVAVVTAEVKKKEEERKRREGSSKPDPAAKALLAAAEKLSSGLKKVEQRLFHPPDAVGLLPDTDAYSKVEYVLRSLQSSWDAPTPAQLEYLGIAEEATGSALAALNRFYAEDVAAFRKQVGEAALRLLPELPALELKP
ncbi:MAG TPA: hypothetical protein VOA87_01270 [Thermoanaerobaculia bacterium]|nr:hypothetical protein [Thermoanaerobaculia bacterium]